MVSLTAFIDLQSTAEESGKTCQQRDSELHILQLRF